MNLKNFCEENMDKNYLLNEWDYIKNKNFDITKINHSSDKKVWWTHKVNRFGKQCTHSWQATIVKRAIKGTNYPYCANRLIIEDENSLQALYPEIAKEWDYEKNKNLIPEMVNISSHKKVYWKCKNNHSWINSISHRTQGESYPYCLNKKAWKGFNDIGTKMPELIKYWNDEQDYCNFLSKSGKSVNWKCPNCSIKES